MTIDLSNMDRVELEKLKTQVETALVEAEKKDLKAALAAAEKAAADHGFSLAEVTGAASVRKSRGGSKSLAPAKYRNPLDESQTWTGKGRQPAWFKTALANGATPDMLEV